MKMKRHYRLFLAFVTFGLLATTVSSCSSDEQTVEPVREGIKRSELILTEITGESVEAHGDHFHGLDAGVEAEPIVISFNEKGDAVQNGHLHLEADAAYKIELKFWDYNDKELQNEIIASKANADQYKAFLIGGNFVLNPDSQTQSGAIFQPRESTYGDGTAVDGKYEVTGILSYFTVGQDNQGATKQVTYVLRKLNGDIKGKIERTDWNRPDYAATFSGENVLELTFEIHAEEGHDH